MDDAPTGSQEAGPAITLVTADVAVLDAALDSPQALSRALGGAQVAEGWVVFDGALPQIRDALAQDPGSARWSTRLFLADPPAVLVGWGGFKGPPADGVVELGYAVAPAHRGRGVAGAAVHAMLNEAFAAPEVSAVTAHTLAGPNASTRVLERCGFERDGDAGDDAMPQWRWRRDRPVR